MVGKSGCCSPVECDRDSGVNLGIEAKLKERISLFESQPFQIPEKSIPKSPHQVQCGEDGIRFEYIASVEMMNQNPRTRIAEIKCQRVDNFKPVEGMDLGEFGAGVENHGMVRGNFKFSSKSPECFDQSREIEQLMEVDQDCGDPKILLDENRNFCGQQQLASPLFSDSAWMVKPTTYDLDQPQFFALNFKLSKLGCINLVEKLSGSLNDKDGSKFGGSISLLEKKFTVHSCHAGYEVQTLKQCKLGKANSYLSKLDGDGSAHCFMQAEVKRSALIRGPLYEGLHVS
ncbi:hypothetical protein U1Q18_022258 [Sarracenia purpurea var. burkii]